MFGLLLLLAAAVAAGSPPAVGANPPPAAPLGDGNPSKLVLAIAQAGTSWVTAVAFLCHGGHLRLQQCNNQDESYLPAFSSGMGKETMTDTLYGRRLQTFTLKLPLLLSPTKGAGAPSASTIQDPSILPCS